jgi:hypothetical protein
MKYAEETRRGVYVGGMLRAVHKTGVRCEAGSRRWLVTKEWSKVTCKHCLRRRPKRGAPGRKKRKTALPKGIRFATKKERLGL